MAHFYVTIQDHSDSQEASEKRNMPIGSELNIPQACYTVSGIFLCDICWKYLTEKNINLSIIYSLHKYINKENASQN